MRVGPLHWAARVHERWYLLTTAAAALLAGGLVPLAFAPHGWWWIAVLAPAVLFHLWSDCTRRRAAVLGLLFGIGMWGVGIHWIFYAWLYVYDQSVALAVGFTIAFVLVMALFTAALGACVGSGSSRQRGAGWLILLAPTAWVAVEWVRSWLFSGFPWLLLGTSQIDSPLAGLAPLVGVYGVGLAVAASAGVLAALPRLRGVRLRAAVAGVALVWGSGLVLDGRAWTEAAGEPLRAGLVQGDFGVNEKLDSVPRSLERYPEMTRVIAAETDLVIWPETAIPAYWEEVAEELNDFAAELGDTDVVTGIFTRDPDAGHIFNSIRPLGRGREVYSKQHLIPFGEYVPFTAWMPFLDGVIDVPLDLTVPPEPQQPIRAAGVRIGAFVCYEAAHPAIARNLAGQSGLLVNVSNDAWFRDSAAPAQHLEITRMRALENGLPLLRATNNGISAIIDHHGAIAARGPQFEAITLVHTVQPRTGRTPYTRAGDAPTLILLGLILGGSFLRRRRDAKNVV